MKEYEGFIHQVFLNLILNFNIKKKNKSKIQELNEENAKFCQKKFSNERFTQIFEENEELKDISENLSRRFKTFMKFNLNEDEKFEENLLEDNCM